MRIIETATVEPIAHTIVRRDKYGSLPVDNALKGTLYYDLGFRVGFQWYVVPNLLGAVTCEQFGETSLMNPTAGLNEETVLLPVPFPTQQTNATYSLTLSTRYSATLSKVDGYKHFFDAGGNYYYETIVTNIAGDDWVTAIRVTNVTGVFQKFSFNFKAQFFNQAGWLPSITFPAS